AAVELANPTPVANDYCGFSVAAGDINGDGRADLIMGCQRDDTGAADAGNMIVFTRNAANTGFDAAVEVANPTPTASDYCGRATAVGDINADGRSDLIMGCFWDDTGAADTGNMIVMLSTSTGVAGSVGTVQDAVELANPTPDGSEYCGTSVAAGDVNGDGRSDLIMGCYYDSTGA
ncbi:MAG: FG-GAP repeat protein, partial [Thermoleophilia bacterium]|nr:FG-GAP repeat protein [Thermoleophilia bacterium]